MKNHNVYFSLLLHLLKVYKRLVLSNILQIIALLLTVFSINGYTQTSEKLMFDQAVLSRVASDINGQGQLDDQEKLLHLIANDARIKAWIHKIISPSVTALNSTILSSTVKLPLANYALIRQKTRNVFFDRGLFDSIPSPELVYDGLTIGYSERNAPLLSDLKFFREEVNQVFEDAGINALFDRNTIPGEDDDLTNVMLLNPPVSRNGKLSRPLFDQAMVFEKKYRLLFDQLKTIEGMMEKALQFMEALIQDWSVKADYYPLSEQEKSSDKAKESSIYRISRAILMKLCQEKINELKAQLWRKKMDNLAFLSDQTANVFSVVDWNSATTKRSDLANPLIQMAQRAITISSRLDLLIFEAGVIQNQGQLTGKTYQRTLEGSF